MLFLLNDRVIELESPEARVLGRWRDMGASDPREMRAHEAVAFVASQFKTLSQHAGPEQDEAFKDWAALIISKTGANSLILTPTASGDFEPRLRDVPPLVLETYLRGAANDEDDRQRA